jgi:methylated-DNA-[protein]-cysteine S-methyltransferase
VSRGTRARSAAAAGPVCYACVDSPIGRLLLAGRGGALGWIGFATGPRALRPRPAWREAPTAFAEARRQLAGYFAGRRRAFALSLAPAGTPFQRAVWRALGEIPYGTTLSYAELARRIGRPGASRAVGAANGDNPLAIVIPCHRLVGSRGQLTGYGGGLSAKRALLDLERRRGAAPRTRAAESRSTWRSPGQRAGK